MWQWVRKEESDRIKIFHELLPEEQLMLQKTFNALIVVLHEKIQKINGEYASCLDANVFSIIKPFLEEIQELQILNNLFRNPLVAPVASDAEEVKEDENLLSLEMQQEQEVKSLKMAQEEESLQHLPNANADIISLSSEQQIALHIPQEQAQDAVEDSRHSRASSIAESRATAKSPTSRRDSTSAIWNRLGISIPSQPALAALPLSPSAQPSVLPLAPAVQPSSSAAEPVKNEQENASPKPRG